MFFLNYLYFCNRFRILVMLKQRRLVRSSKNNSYKEIYIAALGAALKIYPVSVVHKFSLVLAYVVLANPILQGFFMQ